ncbi:MAG: single-stranded DNA-binding protein [Bacilli bacterium]|nr:single-stranded DNA-binding protein [Bacilli bacterium]
MLNQVVLVGRLVRDPEVKKAKNGNSYSYITLAVPRSYKNVNGEYETDFIDCVLWQLMATNTKEYCKKGDIVGVKGRIESRVYETDDEKQYITEVIAEKVTFLSSNKQEAEEA